MTFTQCCPKSGSSSGGVAIGGSASVQVAGRLYDGWETVLPLDESGTTFLDRTDFHHDGTGTNTSVDDGVWCQNSQHLDGTTSYVTVVPDNLRVNQSFTATIWGRIETFYVNKCFFSRGSFTLGVNFLNKLQATVSVMTTDSQITTYTAKGATVLTQGTFYHCAAVWDREAGQLRVYLNGVLDGSVVVPEYDTAPLTESFLGSLSKGQLIQGNLQEFRLSPCVRSAEWLLAEYNNICGNLYSVGPEMDSIFG